ncbi:MAG TPA: hypothetical protein VFG23_02105 [Polyangia bacterium]|nr:hypothetical protein [Polyangia bacterium]
MTTTAFSPNPKTQFTTSTVPRTSFVISNPAPVRLNFCVGCHMARSTYLATFASNKIRTRVGSPRINPTPR